MNMSQHERVELRMAEQAERAEYQSETIVRLSNIAQLLMELLAETRQVRAALAASGSVSSVQLEQDSKGQVKLTVKAYESSNVESAGTAALEAFGRLFREVERQQAAGWKAA